MFVVVIQLPSHVWLLVTQWNATYQASLFLYFLELAQIMSIELVMVSNHLMFCSPLLLLPSIFTSIRDFSNELALPIRWPKYLSFSFHIGLSNKYSGLISFTVDWLALLAVWGTLKSLIQHPNLKASILQCSAFLWANSQIHSWLLEKP